MSIKKLNFSILGAPQVGKSNISSRFYQDTFNQEYDPTVQGVFTRKIFLNGDKYLITLTDTAGQQKFKSFSQIWTQQKDGFIFVYDITRIDSYQIAIERIQTVKRNVALSKIPCILVGNKLDLEWERKIWENAVRKKALELNVKYMETSAKDRVNIKELFHEMIWMCQSASVVEIKPAVEKSEKSQEMERRSKGFFSELIDSCDQKCLLF